MRALKLLFALLICAGVVVLGYGFMKLYRAENAKPSEPILVDLPGVTVVTPDEDLRLRALQIVAGSAVVIVLSVCGFVWVRRRLHARAAVLAARPASAVEPPPDFTPAQIVIDPTRGASQLGEKT
jgi:hypothetical protein